MQQGLFRKAAIDKASSPEQLDLMMEVTSPLGWVALSTVGVLLGAVGLWSLFGSIPDLVDGRGVLMKGERLYEVKTGMAGAIVRLNVTPGATVAANQVVAVISRDRAGIEERRADEIALARSEEMLQIKRAELTSVQSQRATQAELVNRGLKAGNVLFEYDRRVNAVLGELSTLERETALLRSRMQTTAEITTPEAGTVVEVVKGFGDKVGEGEALMRIEPATRAPGPGQRDFCGGATHAVLYVAAKNAGKVRVGQPARVSPLDVKREEFGYLVGRVEWIASFAASPDDMNEKLKNTKLVQTYGEEGPVFEARVCLEADPNNRANGFKWSSSRGPDRPVSSGVQCSASLVVDQRRPYTYVIPAIRRTVGI